MTLLNLFSCSTLVAADPIWDVIVIGGGISGLSAARQLADKDLNVVVLEARNRLGGRIWSYSLPDGQVVDLGASWIQGTRNNPLMNLVKKTKTVTAATDFDNDVLYLSNGKMVSEEEGEKLEALSMEFSSFFDKNIDVDKSVGDLFNAFVSEKKISPKEIHELRFLVSAALENEYAADMDLLSSEVEELGGMKGNSLLMPNGYSQLLSPLSEGLNIKLNQVVKKIETLSSGMKVTTIQGNVFQAHAVICTLPLGVLKSGDVEFSPALPVNKQEAIERMGVGLLDKVALVFDTVFWPKGVELIGYISEDARTWGETLNLYPYTKKATLIAFNSGSIAESFEEKSDQQIVDLWMKAFNPVFKGKIQRPRQAIVTRWGKDPFAQGSYSYLPVGVSSKDFDLLAAPVGERLYFAGEATNGDYSATVHGAYLSGLRAASELLNNAKIAKLDR